MVSVAPNRPAILAPHARDGRLRPGAPLGLVLDEWGTWWDVEPGTNPGFLYQQNTLRDALVAGVHFDIFHRHADRLRWPTSPRPSTCCRR